MHDPCFQSILVKLVTCLYLMLMLDIYVYHVAMLCHQAVCDSGGAGSSDNDV